jgi:asparagine synthase (glutamine-hydrolysing)
MVAALAHRGPDDRGTWISPEHGVALGHTRLSIIDLSGAGHQPMGDADGRLWIVFNGEIYNFLELRRELEARGRRFRTRTDTEVVLAAFAEWGPECVEHLVGMFAFAVVDTRPPDGAPELVLARDRLGIKPLLYAWDGPHLWFASELKALVASGRVPKILDPDALVDFFAVGSIFQPRTIYRDVSALPPGTRLEIRRGAARIVQYWDLHEATREMRRELRGVDAGEAAAKGRALVQEATRYHLVADVPVGAFLSGGLDSTTVVGFMTRATSVPVKTFSVGFERRFHRIDERHFARTVARHLGTDHEEIVISVEDARDLLPQIIRSIDQPSLDGTNTWLVSRAARTKVKVSLSGLGGDELLAGYPHFDVLRELHAVPAGSAWLGALAERLLRIRWSPHLLRAMFRAAPPAGRLSLLRRLLSNRAIRKNTLLPGREEAPRHLMGVHGAWLRDDADPIQRTSYDEVRGYLLSTLLRDCDAVSMAHGLEVRPVLLHHPLVEYLYALPDRLKPTSGSPKPLLSEIASEFLPAEIRNRSKAGFELPLGEWLVGPASEQVDALLAGRVAARLIAPRYRAELRRRLRAGSAPRALWAWAVLLGFIEDNDASLDALLDPAGQTA